MKHTPMMELRDILIEVVKNSENGLGFYKAGYRDALISISKDIEEQWIAKEKKELISFGYTQINWIDSEIGDLIYKKNPEEIYTETYINKES